MCVCHVFVFIHRQLSPLLAEYDATINELSDQVTGYEVRTHTKRMTSLTHVPIYFVFSQNYNH